MVATIAQIIGKVNPKLYAENGEELLREYGSAEEIPADKIKVNPEIVEHKLMYDSSSETLEPVYFFVLDLMNDFKFETEKLIDNFASSPGSGHFAELGQRAVIMQQQATKIMGDINTVLRSVLNIIYDLKEFRIRLNNYNDLKTDKKEAAVLALKQIWLDKVDLITKGNSSIKAMALGQSAGFQTLLDAFLVVKDLKDVDKIDLNDRVKRILRPRILEFNDWMVHSEKELRKRYEIEKTYLRSQVNSLKLYSRWAKPYLRTAQQLEVRDVGREPAMVKVFNTILLELTLLGKLELKIKETVLEGKLPKQLENYKPARKCYSCVLVDFKFRGIPQKIGAAQPHYVFGGRADISFKAYVLNEDEIKKLDEELEKSDLGDVLRLIEGATTQSLEELQDEINFFLEDAEAEEKSEKKSGSNPFAALVGSYGKKEKKEKESTKEKVGKIKPDTFVEKELLRPIAEETAEEFAFKLFDIYKKAHGMPSYT